MHVFFKIESFQKYLQGYYAIIHGRMFLVQSYLSSHILEETKFSQLLEEHILSLEQATGNMVFYSRHKSCLFFFNSSYLNVYNKLNNYYLHI